MLALACLAGAASLWGAEALKAQALAVLGAGMPAALAAEALLAAMAFLLPTLLMGALFSHLATQARGAGIGLGLALGVNTLGAAAAPVLFGVLMLPAIGAKAALLVIAGGYLLLALPFGQPRGIRLPIAIGTALAALAWLAPPLAFVSVPEGGRVLSYREGAMAAVSVVEEGDGTRRLRINNRQQEGSNAAWSADARQALLPLLLHPAPKRALFLGLGTGTTATAATLDPALSVEAVELLPEVVDAAAWFAAPGQARNDRLHIVTADARRFVRAGSTHYDLIVSDNFHPARSGSAALYTVEHFHAVRERLAADGLFFQWLPLHQLDAPTLRSIVRAFLTAFPNGGALLATHSLETPVLGLVGHAAEGRFDLARLRQRVADAHRWPVDPAGLGLTDEYAVLGSLVAGPQALQRLAGDAPPNTDDHPIVAYLAPRATYAPAEPPRERLSALMADLSLEPQEWSKPTRSTPEDWPPTGRPAPPSWPRAARCSHERRAPHAGAGAAAPARCAAHQPRLPPGLRPAAADGGRARAQRCRCRTVATWPNCNACSRRARRRARVCAGWVFHCPERAALDPQARGAVR
jgi:spermidine synthase